MSMYQLARSDVGSHCYAGSGYVLAKVQGEDKYVIADVSHCSCYGTWSGYTNDGELHGANEAWSGTWQELRALAERQGDPTIPDRVIEGDDYDAQDLRAIYAEMLTMEEPTK